MKLLASRGADLNARVWSGNPDGEYRTALSMARRRGHKDVGRVSPLSRRARVKRQEQGQEAGAGLSNSNKSLQLCLYFLAALAYPAALLHSVWKASGFPHAAYLIVRLRRSEKLNKLSTAKEKPL